MSMIRAAQTLDWSEWFRGFVGATVSGGAGAVGSGFAISHLDKAHDVNIFEAMAFTFAFSAAISLAKFLQMHPTPDPLDPKAS